MNASKSSPSLIPKQWQIPQIFRDRLGADPGIQRIMSEEGHYLIVLHQVPSAADRGNRKPALFWINEASEWRSTPLSGGLSGLVQHVTEYEEKVKALETELDLPATNESADVLHKIHDDAAPLNRAARHMLAILQELRQFFPQDRKILLLRDAAVNIERSADLLLTDTKSSLEFITAKSAMRQASEAHNATIEANKLNRLAAFFFPVITIASVLSINDPMKALTSPSTYLIIIVGFMLGIVFSQRV